MAKQLKKICYCTLVAIEIKFIMHVEPLIILVTLQFKPILHVHERVCSGILRSCTSFLPFAVTIVRHLGTAKGAYVPTAITIELFANYFSNIKFLYITYNKPPIRRMILYSTRSPNVCYLIIISTLQ